MVDRGPERIRVPRRHVHGLAADGTGLGRLCHLRRDRGHGGEEPDPFRASIDHKLPRSRGGTNDPQNLQLTHLWCNQVKSDTRGLRLLDGPFRFVEREHLTRSRPRSGGRVGGTSGYRLATGYYISIVPETSKIAPGIKSALAGVDREAVKAGEGSGRRSPAACRKP
ncbi:hypothetical protein GS918_28205 [Rhodococcus hoagii]|nr:hypothetical protein [Prescottella equi]